jgi:hypothetical protein
VTFAVGVGVGVRLGSGVGNEATGDGIDDAGDGVADGGTAGLALTNGLGDEARLAAGDALHAAIAPMSTATIAIDESARRACIAHLLEPFGDGGCPRMETQCRRRV